MIIPGCTVVFGRGAVAALALAPASTGDVPLVVVGASTDEAERIAAVCPGAIFCTPAQAGPGLGFRLRSGLWPGPVQLRFDRGDESCGPLLLYLLDHALAGGRTVVVVPEGGPLRRDASVYDTPARHAGTHIMMEPGHAAR